MDKQRLIRRVARRIYWGLKVEGKPSGLTHDPRGREWRRAEEGVADSAWKDLRAGFLRRRDYIVKKFYIGRGGGPAVILYDYSYGEDVPGLRKMFYRTAGPSSEWYDLKRTRPSIRNLPRRGGL